MAAHLLNRAGFGGNPAEIQRLADLGPDGAVSYLLDYEKIPDDTTNPDWAQPDGEDVVKYRQAVQAAAPDQKRQLQQERQKLEYQRMMELRDRKSVV